MKNKILALTDLSGESVTAVSQAAAIAIRMKASIVLVHAITKESPSEELAEMNLNTESVKIRKRTGLTCDILLLKGVFLHEIENLSREPGYLMMVAAVTSPHLGRQRIFGTDIIKIIARVHIPVLVVREGSQINGEFKRIVLPVASHTSFQASVDAVTQLASAYDSEVQLYSIHKEGFEWPERLLANIDLATAAFAQRKIRLKRVKEEQTVYAQGYAKQTLKYARRIKADVICIMSIPSREYYYFAQADKEEVLRNDFNLPVLCAGGGREEPG